VEALAAKLPGWVVTAMELTAAGLTVNELVVAAVTVPCVASLAVIV
jgi:hypothetical protein